MDTSAWTALDFPAKFRLGCEFVEQNMHRLTEDARLALWALREQVQRGDNDSAQPKFWEVTERAKWSAWESLKGKTALDCQLRTLQVLEEEFGAKWWAAIVPSTSALETEPSQVSADSAAERVLDSKTANTSPASTGSAPSAHTSVPQLLSVSQISNGGRSLFISAGESVQVRVHVNSTAVHRVPIPGGTKVEYSVDVLRGHGMFGANNVHDCTVSVFYRAASGGSGGGLWRDPVVVEGSPAERVTHHAGSYTTGAPGELVFFLDNSFSWLDEKDVDLQVHVSKRAAENSTWSPAEILALDPVTGGGTEADLSSKKVNPQDKQRKIVMMGIASGPGLALLRHYAAKGHTIYGCDQRAALLQTIERQLLAEESTRQAKLELDVVDIVDDAAVAAWAQAITRGRSAQAPDILIASVGVSPDMPSNMPFTVPPWSVPAANFDAAIDINVKALMNVCRHFLPIMITRGSGTLVGLSSELGRSGDPAFGAQSVSKFAVEGVLQSIAMALPAPLVAVPLTPTPSWSTNLEHKQDGDASDVAAVWAETAGPFILGLDRDHNGKIF